MSAGPKQELVGPGSLGSSDVHADRDRVKEANRAAVNVRRPTRSPPRAPNDCAHVGRTAQYCGVRVRVSTSLAPEAQRYVDLPSAGNHPEEEEREYDDGKDDQNGPQHACCVTPM
jgi:hypothetical protein